MLNTHRDIRLPSSLGLVDAGSLLATLRDSLADGMTLRIDGADVERVSTPCIQILVAAAQSARSEGLSFELTSLSGVLVDALADLGLAQIFPPTES